MSSCGGSRRDRGAEMTEDATMDRLLSARTVRELIDAPDRTFRRWVAGGKFPPPDRRIGRVLRWRESTVRQFIEAVQ